MENTNKIRNSHDKNYYHSQKKVIHVSSLEASPNITNSSDNNNSSNSSIIDCNLDSSRTNGTQLIEDCVIHESEESKSKPNIKTSNDKIKIDNFEIINRKLFVGTPDLTKFDHFIIDLDAEKIRNYQKIKIQPANLKINSQSNISDDSIITATTNIIKIKNKDHLLQENDKNNSKHILGLLDQEQHPNKNQENQSYSSKFGSDHFIRIEQQNNCDFLSGSQYKNTTEVSNINEKSKSKEDEDQNIKVQKLTESNPIKLKEKLNKSKEEIIKNQERQRNQRNLRNQRTAHNCPIKKLHKLLSQRSCADNKTTSNNRKDRFYNYKEIEHIPVNLELSKKLSTTKDIKISEDIGALKEQELDESKNFKTMNSAPVKNDDPGGQIIGQNVNIRPNTPKIITVSNINTVNSTSEPENHKKMNENLSPNLPQNHTNMPNNKPNNNGTNNSSNNNNNKKQTQNHVVRGKGFFPKTEWKSLAPKINKDRRLYLESRTEKENFEIYQNYTNGLAGNHSKKRQTDNSIQMSQLIRSESTPLISNNNSTLNSNLSSNNQSQTTTAGSITVNAFSETNKSNQGNNNQGVHQKNFKPDYNPKGYQVNEKFQSPAYVCRQDYWWGCFFL